MSRMKLESGHGHTGTTTHQQSPVVDHVDYSRVGKGSADYHAHGLQTSVGKCNQLNAPPEDGRKNYGPPRTGRMHTPAVLVCEQQASCSVDSVLCISSVV